jgi:predicted small secreted protein
MQPCPATVTATVCHYSCLQLQLRRSLNRISVDLKFSPILKNQRSFSMTHNLFTKLFTALCVIGLLGSVTACNTMHGAGKDIERGGEKIQQKADEHK